MMRGGPHINEKGIGGGAPIPARRSIWARDPFYFSKGGERGSPELKWDFDSL